jgi:hypothetical protein
MPRSTTPSRQGNIRIPEHRYLPAIVRSERPSFLQTMKEGVALGVGSSIGHRLVGAIMGQTIVNKPTVNTKQEEYDQCIKENNDIAGCQHILKTKY